jgi:hypothetical protein
MSNTYKCLKVIPTEVVVSALLAGHNTLHYQGFTISIASSRIKTYSKGVNCVHCGRTGDYFSLEQRRSDKKPHLNLYNRTKNGASVMITSDHIIPVSKGGSGCLENRQTMCSPCNSTKSSFSSVEEGKRFINGVRTAKKAKQLAELPMRIEYFRRKILEGDTVSPWERLLQIAVSKLERLKENEQSYTDVKSKSSNE